MLVRTNLTLKSIRQSYELTQDQVGDYIGLSKRNYREKEIGNTPFTQIEIIRMVELFNLNADEVYTLFYFKAFATSFWKGSQFT